MSFMTPPVGRNPNVPDNLIKQRIQYAVDLKLAGLSASSILQKINTEATIKGWGEISLRQLKRDFALYYSGTQVIGDEEEGYIKGLQEIHMESLEAVIEKQTAWIANKQSWKPFEYEKNLKQLFDMKLRHIDLLRKSSFQQPQNSPSTYSTGFVASHDVYAKASKELEVMDPVFKEKMLVEPLQAVIEATEKLAPPKEKNECGINEVEEDDQNQPLSPQYKALLEEYYEKLFKISEELNEEKNKPKEF